MYNREKTMVKLRRCGWEDKGGGESEMDKKKKRRKKD